MLIRSHNGNKLVTFYGVHYTVPSEKETIEYITLPLAGRTRTRTRERRKRRRRRKVFQSDRQFSEKQSLPETLPHRPCGVVPDS